MLAVPLQYSRSWGVRVAWWCFKGSAALNNHLLHIYSCLFWYVKPTPATIVRCNTATASKIEASLKLLTKSKCKFSDDTQVHQSEVTKLNIELMCNHAKTMIDNVVFSGTFPNQTRDDTVYLAAYHHSIATCPGGVQKTTWPLLTTGRLFGDSLVWSEKMAFISPAILLDTPPDNPGSRPGCRDAGLHTSLLPISQGLSAAGKNTGISCLIKNSNMVRKKIV